MKKFAMLMLVCGLAASAGAGTYTLPLYVASPDFDATVTGWGQFGDPTWAQVAVNPSLGWNPDGYAPHILYTSGSYMPIGADSGSQAVLMFSNQNEYGTSSIWTAPSVDLKTGDTWQFSFKAMGETTYGASDIDVFIMDDLGLTYDVMTISGSTLSNTAWTEISYTGTYTGEETMLGGGWTIFIRGRSTAPAGTFQSILIDTVTPEPTTMAVLGLGGLAALIRRKK